MQIDFYNIEEKIFLEKRLQQLLPELKPLFDRWNFAKINGLFTFLKSVENQLLDSLSEGHMSIIEEYYKETVIVNKNNTNIVKDYSYDLNEDFKLHKSREYKDFCISRDKNNVFLTFWR
jgi:predicted phage-related endonuclease